MIHILNLREFYELKPQLRDLVALKQLDSDFGPERQNSDRK